MKAIAIAAASFTALVMIGVTAGGFNAAAAPGDYSTLPVDPNIVTDSLAYTAAAPVLNPNGQPGVNTVYNHRDGSHQITNTILVLPDPAAATAAMNGSQANLTNTVTNSKTQPAQVGSGGTVVSGTSPDGSKSVTLLTFTEGNTATTIEFDGPPKDPAPADVVDQYGQQQDDAIKTQLAGWASPPQAPPPNHGGDVCISCIG
jgi:hypothetical protein